MRPVLRYAAFVALLSLPLAHGQDVQVDKGKHAAEISISGDKIKELLESLSVNATEKNTTAERSPPIKPPQMVDLTGLGTPKVAQQKTEDKRVEQEAGKAGTTFKMPPKVKAPPPPAGETKEDKPAVDLADLKAKVGKSSARPNVRRAQSFEHLARRPPGQLPPKDMKPVAPKDNASLRDRLAERIKKAENTGLGGKRFLQSFEHPARRGPSPLSPKDINAVKPKTAPSLRDKLKGYAEAKDESMSGVVSPLKGWIRYLLQKVTGAREAETNPQTRLRPTAGVPPPAISKVTLTGVEAGGMKAANAAVPPLSKQEGLKVPLRKQEGARPSASLPLHKADKEDKEKVKGGPSKWLRQDRMLQV